MSATEVTTPKMQSPRWRWGLLALVLFWLPINSAAVPAIEWIEAGTVDEEIMLMLGLAGIVSGEACCVVILSGLMRRTWIGGYYLGLTIAMLGYAAILLGSWLSDNYDRDMWLALFWLPGWLLAAATPMLLCRQSLGWQIAGRKASLGPRSPFQLGYLFSYMALLAAALVLWRAPQVIMEEKDDYWPPILISAAVMFGVGLLVLPLATKLAFGLRSRLAALGGLFGVALALAILLFGIMQCFQTWNTPWSERLEAVPFLLSYLIPLFCIFYFSLGWLVWCGYGLHKTHRPLATDKPTEPAVSKWQVRLRIAAAVAVAVVTSAALSRLEQWRRVKDAELGELSSIAQQLGGNVHISERTVVGLTLGSMGTDNDLLRFWSCDQITYIHLFASQITDVGLAHLRRFPKLVYLTANQTAITDQGLQHLSGVPLTTLQVDDTAITGPGLAHLNQALVDFHASGAPVADEGLVHLAKLPNLKSLDLSDTNVSFGVPELQGFPTLDVLILNGTPVDDRGVTTLARIPNLEVLHLGRTQITDAGLSELARCEDLSTLEIADTAVTNDGVAHLKDSQLVLLDLSGTAVTGTAFENWGPGRVGMSLGTLRLDRTPITDAQLSILQQLSPLRVLSLADTAITDQGLVHLGGMSIEQLNLSRTKVTALGLLSNGLTGVTSLSVSPDQFPPAQMTQLEGRFGTGLIRVGVDFD